MRRVCALILAAGESLRMGSPKQLLEIGGVTLIEHVSQVALAADFEQVVVVLGAHTDAIAPKIAGLGVRILLNADWKEGMASSIRCGVGALLDADGILILLVDQPGLTAETLIDLRERFEAGDADVVTASNNGVTSPPAAFAPSMFPRLLSLQGEKGAKALLADARVVEMEMPEAKVDLDTLEDYMRFRG